MTIRLNPYLNFRNSARDAMEFYRSIFGGELTSSTFSEIDMPHEPDEDAKILHSMLVADNGLTLMAADVPN
ncbi:MAG: VOC family protein, partial [Actinomycetota bacterium]|nr:VOC family protein [Actinomycetota bacterium]